MRVFVEHETHELITDEATIPTPSVGQVVTIADMDTGELVTGKVVAIEDRGEGYECVRVLNPEYGRRMERLYGEE